MVEATGITTILVKVLVPVVAVVVADGATPEVDFPIAEVVVFKVGYSEKTIGNFFMSILLQVEVMAVGIPTETVMIRVSFTAARSLQFAFFSFYQVDIVEAVEVAHTVVPAVALVVHPIMHRIKKKFESRS